MAFGDTIDDILLYKKFYTGDHLTATPKEIGQDLATWQAFDEARRTLQGTPHPGHTMTWARQYEVGLAWVYVLGDKFRVTIYEPSEDRHLTLPLIDADHPRPIAFGLTFAAGKAALGLT